MQASENSIRFSPAAAAFLLAALALPRSGNAEGYVLQESYLGEVAQDQFGYSCAPAGDVDGDGFADFLAGANVNDEGALSGGKVYLYLGGEDYPTSATLAYAGTHEKEYVGGALAAGDLNGDGYDDWVAGAPGLGADGLAPGRVYVFLGGAEPDAVPDLVLEGEVASGQFGEAVCVIPDLDGDGHGDLAVGAPRAEDGRVYLYRGGEEPLDGTPDRVLEARPEDQRFGWALAFLPDLDDDGRDELLVGAPRSGEAAVWGGAVLLYHGSEDLDPTADLVFPGESAGDEFGRSLGAGADLDGDGEPDLVVGAPFANADALVDAGKAYFFEGGSLLDTAADLVFAGDVAQARLGAALSVAFDWDGDMFGDLALGLPDDDTGGTNAGACAIYLGGPALDVSSDVMIVGSEAGLHIGRAVAAGGDLRHNVRGTLLVGGYAEADAGRLLLYGSNEAPVAAGEVPPAAGIRLDAPWPNPANPAVSIAYSLERRGRITLSVHDARGRRVAILIRGEQGAGRHQIIWRGDDTRGRPSPSGLYLLRLSDSVERQTRKLILVR